MLDAVGLPVTRLVRMRVGPVRLGGLAPGERRELTHDEVVALRQPRGRVALSLGAPRRRSRRREVPMRLRAARGAIRVPRTTVRRCSHPPSGCCRPMLERNEVDTDDLVSIIFTATQDLRSAFPAEAARRMGLGRVPLMCAQEIPVEGSMPSVVRVLVHFHSDRTLDEVAHVYLDGAESLRDDLG